MLVITTDPRAPGSGIGARRKNGDRIYLRGENIRQLKIVRKVLMKLAKHFDLPMATFTDFVGLEHINTSNEELLECLSTVPDPYAPVDERVAMVASTRDFKIANRILSRPRQSTLEQLLAVSANSEDWSNFWRVRSSKGFTPERIAEEAKLQKLKASNREKLEQRSRSANGQHTN
jgi:hypothetical protein